MSIQVYLTGLTFYMTCGTFTIVTVLVYGGIRQVLMPKELSVTDSIIVYIFDLFTV